MANRAIIMELDKQVDTSLSLNSTGVRQQPVPNPCIDTNENVATTKCNHFSIRGYVSEVRKRDPKLCYPFPLNESIDPANELPPMTIPESRWWRCSGCVPEAKNYDDCLPKDTRGVAKEEAQKGADVNNASNTNLLLGLSIKVDNSAAGVRIPEAFGSTDSDYNKNNTPVVSNTLSDRKGKGKAHVTYDEIPPFSGCENGFVTFCSNQKTFQQTTGQIEINQRATDNEVVRARSNDNRIAVGLHKESATGRTEVGSSKGYSGGDPQTSTQHRLSQSPTNGLVARVAGNVSGSCSRSQGLVTLPDLNECSGEPSDDELRNEATVTGNYIILCEDEDDYLGTERRKMPKSRLMSELLSLKETQYPGKGKKKMISSTSYQDENVKRKRVEIVISDSEYESDSSDVSDEKMSGSSGKRRYKSKDSLVEMEKKKMKIDNGASSSSFSPQKITKPKSSQERGKLAEVLPQRVDHFAHLSEPGNMVKRKRGTTAKDFGATQKNGEVAEQNSIDNVGKPSGNAGHVQSNNLNKENNQPLLQKINLYPSASQVPKEKESRHCEETCGVTLSRNSAVGAPFTTNQSDPERRVDYPTTSSSEKTTRTPETYRCRPPAQDITVQVSNSVPNQKEQTKEVRGRIHDIDINSIPTDDKPNEVGPGEDNLMEIAELMVKIRHERQQLNDPIDNNHVSSEPPRPLPGTNVRQYETPESYGQPIQIFRSSPSLNVQMPPSTMVNGNSSQYSHYNGENVGVRGLPRENNQNPASSRFVYPNQDVEHINPYSARRLPSNFVQAWSTQQGLTQPSSVWPSPGMPSRMPLGITNPRQMISPRSNINLNDGRFRHQNSRTFLNFENPESSSRPSTGVDVNNEAIPAMHLLNTLMQNAATVQNTELSLGPQRLVPPSSSRFPFSNNNNSRNFAVQDNSSHPCYPSTLPTASPCPSSSHNDNGMMGRNNGSSNGFMGPIPLTLGGQRNMESSRFAPPPPSRNPRPPRQVRRPMAPPLDKGKGIASTSTPTSVNNSLQVVKESLNLQSEKPISPPAPLDKGKGIASNSNPTSVNNPLQVVKESLNLQCEKPVTPPESEEITCQLNQNPSEFNDLKLLAKYMNGPGDLRPRKTSRGNDTPRPKGNYKRQD
ncbi:hypothetical protein KSS87_000548 [Heliosperma pusillum]|nr:hypothetical protein KSS87_000548 [Heliosperma pusillum]